MTDLQGVGRVLGSLAGEVEHDTQSIRQFWPKGRTGRLAATDAARIGGALDECHQVFGRAERALSELFPVLVAGRRKVDDLNHAYLVLAGPMNTYDGALSAAFPSLARPQQLFVAEDTLRAALARSGFEHLADIDRAYAKGPEPVAELGTERPRPRSARLKWLGAGSGGQGSLLQSSGRRRRRGCARCGVLVSYLGATGS